MTNQLRSAATWGKAPGPLHLLINLAFLLMGAHLWLTDPGNGPLALQMILFWGVLQAFAWCYGKVRANKEIRARARSCYRYTADPLRGEAQAPARPRYIREMALVPFWYRIVQLCRRRKFKGWMRSLRNITKRRR